NGGAGAWVALGASLGAGGISGTGLADQVRLVNTAAGLVAVWLDDSSGTNQVYARRFDGSTWAVLGAASGAGISAAPADADDLAVATDGTRIAVAWARLSGDDHQIYVRQFNGSIWQDLPGASGAQGLSASTGDHRAPALSYVDGTLVVAWQRMLDGYQNLQGRSFDGAAWTDLGALTAHGPATDNATIARDARLASGGGRLWLFWTDEDTRRSDQPQALYAKVWNGSGFVARVAADAEGDGLSESGGRLSGVAVGVSATGTPLVAWSEADRGFSGDPALPAIYLRTGMPVSGNVYSAANNTELQNILAGVDLDAGDVIQLGAGSFEGFTVSAGNAGVTIVGAAGQATQINGAVVIGATDVALQGLVFNANVSTSSASDRFTLRDSRFLAGKLVLGGGQDLRIVHNRFGSSGLQVTAASGGAVSWNDLAGMLDIDAAFAGRIDHNDIHGASIGVDYGAAADLRDNRIWGNTTGIRTTVAGSTQGLGFTPGAGSNEIYANSTGIQAVGAQFQNQWVRNNSTGVTGTGIVGGSSLDLANRIEANQQGIANFNGTVQYSRIAGNTTGIAATNGLLVAHNLVYRNTGVGLLVSGVSDVRIYQNTFYAPAGDNIRVQSAASNVEVRGNILWARAGYDLFVANDSQTGFFSDYNNLYADQGGRIGYWTRDFTDVLDWQADIARFDLHSIGATVVNPLWAKPQFLDTDRNDFRLFAATAGLRFTSPDVEGADARLDQAVPPHYLNLLANSGFEAGLTGWSANAGAGVKTGSPAAFEGSQYFSAGNVEEGQVQQTVDLLAAGFTAAQLDAGDLDMVFGGRTRSAAESPVDRGALTLQFFDATSAPIALGSGGSTVSATALNASDRWELIGGRTLVPAGARYAVLRFTADRDSGTSNDAWLDKAFLYAVSEAYVPDLGAYGHATHEAPASADTRILLRFPDMYTDWERLEPLTIRWETVNNTTRSPVRIDLIQDGPAGPAFVLNIASGTADDGEFIWIPGNSGIGFGTHGLRIQVSLVHDATVLDRSQESFSVPEDGATYYVDDASNAGDEYTPGATGANRNTGKTPEAPKPNPVNVLREYTLDSFSSLLIDTGNYPMIYSVLLSGSVDTGLGLDEGFLLTGPTNTAVAATLFPAIAGDRSRALIELNDADFMTVRHLSLRDADRGLYVRNGSDAFEASWITAWGHDQDGIAIDSASAFGALDHLTAYGNTRYGMLIDGDFASITNSLAYGNGNIGIYVTAAVDLFTDNLARDNTSNWGIYLSAPGNSLILRNESHGNRYGMFVSNSSGTAWVGSLDLAAGDGNRVHDNLGAGLSVQNGGVHAAGNTVYGHTASGQIGLSVSSGAQASSNLVYDNTIGIDAFGSTISNNRVYHNTGTGIQASQSSLLGNVVYSNARGITWNGGGAYVLRNNLVYGNSQSGIAITGNTLQVINNTVVQDAGNAIGIDNASNIKLFNNILWSGASFALSVSSNSQVGFESDYNLFYTTGLAAVGQWQGTSRNSLSAWRVASFTDANSLFADPQFVDRDGADGVVGFVSALQDGRDDDLHLGSLYGSSHGGSLAPVRDGVSGLPVAAAISVVSDGVQSVGIDRGRASDSSALEPQPNGGFINIGAYGGTAQASRSPSQYITVFAANGGESVPQESTYDIRWRAHGFTGNVDIEVSADAGGSWTLLADSELNDGSYAWVVNPAQFAVGSRYLVRVTAEVDPAITDVSDRVFTVTEPINLYYVNLAGDADFTDNEYTVAAGSDLNDGLSAATPMASIRAVLERYDLDAGDVILVDTGRYLLTTNISLIAQDSGVVIRGAMAAGHTTLLDRGNTTSSSHIFQFAGADNVTLDHLSMTGAYHAVLLASGVDSDNITVSNSEIYRNASDGLNVQTGNEGFLLVGSNVRENASSGITLNALRGAITGNALWGNGQWGISASASGATNRSDWMVVSGNRSFDNANGIYGWTNVEVRENE
ncbi:MAG: right-handed parallel beta-helix repeat-containing protein, partial [Rhodoferax sp.]|nr:right-handed parallel beta-helix repeat-containing protein [Rhodoferax sp.]